MPALGALAALAAVLSLSCSPANVMATADGGDATAVESACHAYAYAYCTHLETCSTTTLQTRFSAIGTCESLYVASCVNAMESPSTAGTVATRNACTDAIPGWACADFIQGQNPPPGCVVQAGSLPEGAGCAFNSQCQSSFCGLPGGSACGTCAPQPVAGAPCVFTQCGQGLSCALNSMTCIVPALEGASCVNSFCSTGLACIGGKCTLPASGLGSPCDYAGAGCNFVSGLVCNGESNTCVTATLALPGQACGMVGGQQQNCAAGLCVEGACVGDPLVGEACQLDGPPCYNDTRCVLPGDGGVVGTCLVVGTLACE